MRIVKERGGAGAAASDNWTMKTRTKFNDGLQLQFHLIALKDGKDFKSKEDGHKDECVIC
ncbi:hypothetical protein OUZ56_003883 [Daphnia magna]|uniref:Uncharacterized protein n=1 Tax=Daphnia magna TaxID=35525 RepID=A0ABQ9YN38_9CRUS|nr:hypothetical protein OUZ56_003883 [Daphnia magna]